MGHYVNYRKQKSPSFNELLPEDEFRLFAITSRFPDSLAKAFQLEERQAGVYDISVGGLLIRVLVIRDLRNEPINAMLKLFSNVPAQIEFACEHYRKISHDTTGMVDEMIRLHQKEDKNMAKTLEELKQKWLREALESASVKDRLRGLTPEQRLEGLPAEERLKGLPADEFAKRLPVEERLKGVPADELVKRLPVEERLKGVPADELVKRLPVEERLKGLSADEIEAYLLALKKAKSL